VKNPNHSENAFPLYVNESFADFTAHYGLSKREYFAAQIYAQLIHIDTYGFMRGEGKNSFTDLASDAVSAADALIRALQREDS
jgi:hypothetical protein